MGHLSLRFMGLRVDVAQCPSRAWLHFSLPWTPEVVPLGVGTLSIDPLEESWGHFESILSEPGHILRASGFRI